MSRKKHPEHVNHERWLVSYADFITLLFAFFVVLFASGQSDKRKRIQLANAVQSAFTHNGIFDQHSKTPPISEQAGQAQAAQAQTVQPAPLVLPVPLQAALEHAAELRIRQVIATEATHHKLPPEVITLHPSPEGLVVSLREAGFFASGSADLRPDSLGLLDAVAGALPHQPMRVEGHTDNIPIHTQQFATNWELSTARAATITRLLLSRHAVAPDQVAAAGYAEFHPAADNATEAGRTQNRRVDIILLKLPAPSR